MVEKNIRWIQRFGNFKKALMSFRRAVQIADERPLNELEQQGLIQSFEYTHELAWKTLKDFLNHKGVQDLYGSKDTNRKAFKEGLIKNGTVWMEMIQCRNLT
ncbi:MAG: nucleotidyltransferase [Bacteroidetes bacterium HGW-Bacteroidetes-13]|nr:MAG: nucleotidyltransferase [Bacteroidetes bacterium HGW-Bacteroidetes-13]